MAALEAAAAQDRRLRRRARDALEGGDQGNYQALYEIPRHPPAGRYRLVTANRHRGRTVTLRKRRGTVFPVPEGATVLIARDRFENRALTSSRP